MSTAWSPSVLNRRSRSPDFSVQALAAAAGRPDVALFYGDDVVLGGATIRLNLKPGFNRAMLRAQDYMGPVVVVRAGALRRLGGLRARAATATLYDLVLRADAEGQPIEAIRSVMVAYPQERPACEPSDRRAVLALACAPPGGDAIILPGLTAQSLRLRRRFAAYPEVSLLIPTRQAVGEHGRVHALAMLDSLTSSTWPSDRLRVLIGDDVESDEVYGDLRRFPFPVERMVTRRPAGAPFNYAAKMNQLWRAAQTEHVVMLNDDLQVVAPDWLEALMSFAVDREVGGVGARLLYPNGAVQHAGMIGGPFGVFVHPWIGQPGRPADLWRLGPRAAGLVGGHRRGLRHAPLCAGGGERLRRAVRGRIQRC